MNRSVVGHRRLVLGLAILALIGAKSDQAFGQPLEKPPVVVKEFRLLGDKIKIPLKAAALSRDGKFALSMSSGPAILGLGVQIWNIDTGKTGKELDLKGNVESFAISNDGKRAVFALEDGNVRLWDLTTGKELRQFKGNIIAGAKGVAFSPDGKQVVTGGGAIDETIRLWDAATGKELAPFKGNKRAAPALAFSADGTRLATGGWEGDLRIWDVKTRKQIHLCAGHTKLIQAVAFSPDGMRVVSGSADKTLRVWDTATGQETAKFEEAAVSVNSAAFLPDGNFAIIGCGGDFDVELLPKGARLKSTIGKTGALRIVDLTTGKAVADFPDPGPAILNVTVAAKGRVVTVSYDGTLKVWQLQEAK